MASSQSWRHRTGGRPIVGEPQAVKLWSLPKVVFLFPTMLAAIVAGLGSTFWPDLATTWGLIFMVVFLLNIVVMAFDFPQTSSLTLLFLIVALILGGLLINQHLFVFWHALEDLTRQIRPQANTQFYWLVGGILAVTFIVVVIVDDRFNYWLIYPNEIIHRHGLLGNLSRYPAPGLEMQKEITDIFEYALLRSGRLTIQPTKGPPIVLDTVVNINRKQRQIQQLLDSISVEIAPADPLRHDGMGVG